MARYVQNEEILGKVFGRLTPLKEASPRYWTNSKGKTEKHRYWLCACECGTEKEIRQSHFKNGHIVSCGCFNREETSLRERKLTELPEGYSRNCDQSSEYFIVWKSMIDRCHNPNNENYYNYGARGIKVCSRWLEPLGVGFNNFISDMGERPEGYDIDRQDNSLGYSPSNCKWVSRSDSMYNRRKFSNNTSGRTGVYWIIKSNKWLACITVNKKTIRLGHFYKFEDAVATREAAELSYYGKIKC